MQMAQKIFICETHDMGQLFVEKIQRSQNELFYGASI